METTEFKTRTQKMTEEFHSELANKLKEIGFSNEESGLYYLFEEYINKRLESVENTVFMISNGIAIQKDTGKATLRDKPSHEQFTIKSSHGEQSIEADELIDYLKQLSEDALKTGVPVLPYEYSYLIKQIPSLNRVMKSSGKYPVELIAMLLQKNQVTNNNELVCVFTTINQDIFTYRFRKNNKYDMFTPNYNSTFEIKDKNNIGKVFTLNVVINRNSGLLKIIDMEELNKNEYPNY